MPRRTLLLSMLLLLCLPSTCLAAQLDIVHINVGQGAATLILGPTDAGGGRVSVLIDAGNVTQFGHLDGGRLVVEALNTYGVTGLDYFIATHYHADHIGGLAAGPNHGSCFLFGLDGVPGTQGDDDGDGNANWEPDGEPDLDELGLGAFHDDILVDTFVDRGAVVEPTSVTYGKYADVRTTAQVGTVSLSDQQDVDAYGIGLGASGATQATLTCLAANGYVRNRSARVPGVSDENERSLCFLLSFGDFRYLIGGDATGLGGYAEIEQAVGEYIDSLQPPVTIDVLAVNHHGSEYSSSADFLTDVSPTLAVISVGNDNSEGHPNLEALQRLYDAGVQTIYQTEWGTTVDAVPDNIEDIREVLEGDVVLTSDGQSFWVPRFPDIMPYHWASDEIEACYDAGIVAGYGDGLYHPDRSVTRDLMAVYIARALAGGDDNVPPDSAYPTPSFGDVDSDDWAYNYIEYAAQNNVVQGYEYPDLEHPGEIISLYEPLWTVTRDQMAVYVARALVAPTGEAALADYVPADPRNFPDVPATGYGDDGTEPFWAYKHIEYCVEHGVVNGYEYPDPDTPGETICLYQPLWPVTRDQMAVYIARAFGLIP